MADKTSKWEQNAPGSFYVDDQCIACDACVCEAPGFFEMDDDDGHAFVKLQPTTDEEKQKCIDALDACPVDAIGKDGEAN